jgi:hypothetical protein
LTLTVGCPPRRSASSIVSIVSCSSCVILVPFRPKDAGHAVARRVANRASLGEPQWKCHAELGSQSDGPR